MECPTTSATQFFRVFTVKRFSEVRVVFVATSEKQSARRKVTRLFGRYKVGETLFLWRVWAAATSRTPASALAITEGLRGERLTRFWSPPDEGAAVGRWCSSGTTPAINGGWNERSPPQPPRHLRCLCRCAKPTDCPGAPELHGRPWVTLRVMKTFPRQDGTGRDGAVRPGPARPREPGATCPRREKSGTAASPRGGRAESGSAAACAAGPHL